LFSSVLDNRDDTSMLPLAAYYDKNADPSVYVVLTHDTTFLFLFVIYIYIYIYILQQNIYTIFQTIRDTRTHTSRVVRKKGKRESER